MRLFKFSRDFKLFEAGEIIFRDGEPGDEMYVVQEGSVDIVVGGQIIDVISTDEFFGEMVLINGTVRTASAIARTDCRLAVIKVEQFQFLVEHNPFFREWLMDIFAKRLIKMNQTVLTGDLSILSHHWKR